MCSYEVIIHCTLRVVGEVDTSYNLFENQWHFYSRTVAFCLHQLFFDWEKHSGGQGGRWAYKENPGFASSLCLGFFSNKSSLPEVREKRLEVKQNSHEFDSSGFTLVKVREKLCSQLCGKINNFMKYWLNVKSRIWVHGHDFNMLTCNKWTIHDTNPIDFIYSLLNQCLGHFVEHILEYELG